jgi:hypothetical protein
VSSKKSILLLKGSKTHDLLRLGGLLKSCKVPVFPPVQQQCWTYFVNNASD